MNNTGDGVLTLPGLEVEVLEPDVPAAKFPLNFSLKESAGSIAGPLEYDATLFEPAAVRRFLAHLRTMLAQMLAQPRAAMATLPLMVEKEQRELLALDDRGPAESDSRCLHEIFALRVANARTPLP